MRWLRVLLLAVAGVCPATQGADDSTFLPPDQAFQLAVVATRADAVDLRWQIAPGYYLYKSRFKFAIGGVPLPLESVHFPPGEWKTDDTFGRMEVYHDAVTATVPLTTAAGQSDSPRELKVIYQGCATAGLCYPPITKLLEIAAVPMAQAVTKVLPKSGTQPRASVGAPQERIQIVAAVVPAASTPSPGVASSVVVVPARPHSEQDHLAQLIREGGLLAVLSTFFGLGLLLSLTPCVLPMVPILSGIIVGAGEKTTPARGFTLAMAYVQGMAVTYAASAVIFVLAFKQAPQAFFQKPWIIASFATLFVVLALAMFGVFTLQMPAVIQTRLSGASNRQRSGTLPGTFVMGALSALVVTACVAPALIAALSVIAQTGQIAKGALALYAMGLGMGAPLLLVGASAGSLLPKAGPWMDTIKCLFGVLFLGVALYLLSSLLPGLVVMALWSGLLIISGFWIFSLRGRDKLPAAAPVRGAGLMVIAYGLLLLIGAAAGRTDPLSPLAGVATVEVGSRPEQGTSGVELSFQRVKSVAQFDQELAAARSRGKPVMLDFYADWCTSCKEMARYTFSRAEVQQALRGAVLLQADVTANDGEDQALLRRFGIFGPPTIAFFAAKGPEKVDWRVVGFMPADRFRTQVLGAFQSD